MEVGKVFQKYLLRFWLSHEPTMSDGEPSELLILNDIYYDASTWTHAHTSKQHSVTEQQNSDTTGHKYSKGHHMIERKVLDLTTAVTVTPGTTILPTQMNPVCLPLLYFKREARVGLYLN
ncbi:hypothetical protein GQX74_009997 [Glossina fuscipes]|nr:hypothetical protein GQX74_009997 [Glossina fuscipes]